MLHPRRSRWRVALLLACASLTVAGCAARQSKEQYQERLEAAGGVRQQVSVRVNGDQLSSQGDYEEAVRSLREAADELDSDLPPRNVQAAHDAMVQGLEGLADLLELLATCEGRTDQERRACRQDISQEVFDEVRNDFDEANTIYREEGFSLPGAGSEEGADSGPGADPEGGDEL